MAQRTLDGGDGAPDDDLDGLRGESVRGDERHPALEGVGRERSGSGGVVSCRRWPTRSVRSKEQPRRSEVAPPRRAALVKGARLEKDERPRH